MVSRHQASPAQCTSHEDNRTRSCFSTWRRELSNLPCVRFGVKSEALALLQEWVRDVGSHAGLNSSNTRILSGAIGCPESRLEVRIAAAAASAVYPVNAKQADVYEATMRYADQSAQRARSSTADYATATCSSKSRWTALRTSSSCGRRCRPRHMPRGANAPAGCCLMGPHGGTSCACARCSRTRTVRQQHRPAPDRVLLLR